MAITLRLNVQLLRVNSALFVHLEILAAHQWANRWELEKPPGHSGQKQIDTLDRVGHNYQGLSLVVVFSC
jgi:hypothetical protein